MLYEVITGTPDQELLAQVIEEILVQPPPDARRITSYNVCYTKLLRFQGAGRKPSVPRPAHLSKAAWDKAYGATTKSRSALDIFYLLVLFRYRRKAVATAQNSRIV